MADQQFYSAEARAEPFGYTCNRCLNCCINKRIQVNPYEVARLARNRGVSTSELRDKFTIDGEGTVLDQRDDGSCVFLGEQGCTVHPDRPLVCRLYPLGRQISLSDGENFVHLEPHPETKGIYSKDAIIANYLNDQQAELFILAADEYFRWFCRATDQIIESQDGENASIDAFTLLDLDTAVADYCAKHQIAEPEDIEYRKRLHLAVLNGVLDEICSAK